VKSWRHRRCSVGFFDFDFVGIIGFAARMCMDRYCYVYCTICVGIATSHGLSLRCFLFGMPRRLTQLILFLKPSMDSLDIH